MKKELAAVFVINGKRMERLDTETEEYLTEKITAALGSYFESHNEEWQEIAKKGER